MSLGFIPGEPNRSPHACSFVNWNSIQILAYCSGNNLVILTKNSSHLQTIYLPSDSLVVDVNKSNGKIAIAIENEILIYTPEISNFYNFNFSGRKNLDELKIEWILEYTIKNDSNKDDTDINCLSWSDLCEVADSELDTSTLFKLPPEFNSQTSCELAVGSDKSLTLHRLYYESVDSKKLLKSKSLWFKIQATPVYMVKFSPNATSIVSIGYYDKLVKLWYRLSYNIDFCDFELRCIPHETYVTSLIWKKYLVSEDLTGISSSSAPATPSGSILLRPSNGIIKNDQFIMSSSDFNSISSLSANKKQHNVLYTIANDSVLRVFTTYKLERGFEFFESGSLDLFDAESRKIDEDVIKFVTIIDNSYLDYGLNKMLEKLGTSASGVQVSSENMNSENPSIASRSRSCSFAGYTNRKQDEVMDLLKAKCELCMIFDSKGNVNIYGFSNLCSPIPSDLLTFKLDRITDTEGESFTSNIMFGINCVPQDCRSVFINNILLNPYGGGLDLTLVIQDLFKNSIREIGLSFNEILQFSRFKRTDNYLNKTGGLLTIDYKPSNNTVIGTLQQKFTGHNKSVRKIIRSTDGSSVISLTRFNENYLWYPIPLGQGKITLNKKSTIMTPSPVIKAIILNKGDYVIVLVENSIICYDCRLVVQEHEEFTKLAPVACSFSLNTSKIPLCFSLLPESEKMTYHIVAVYDDKSCRSWEFSISGNGEDQKMGVSEHQIENLPNKDKVNAYIISDINPVGWFASIDQTGRDVLAVVTAEGTVSIYYVSFQNEGGACRIFWHLKESFRTGINNCSFVSGSSIHKIAIVDESRTKLTIWDTKLGILDYEETFKNDQVIKDIDWTSTKYQQGILAVGFRSHSLLYTQLRYDYTNNAPTFAKIKKVDISEQTTHEIGDSVWMSDGLLVIGAGNQFYLSDKKLDLRGDLVTNKAIGSLEIVSKDLFHLCSALNGPLPLYHPQFIIQLLFSGRHKVISKILVKLCKNLREVDLGEKSEIDISLGLSVTELLSDQKKDDKLKGNRYQRIFKDINNLDTNDDDDDVTFDEQCAEILIEKLQKLKLPLLTGHQQITLSQTVSIMKDVLGKYRNILDVNALKFYLTMKLFIVNLSKESTPAFKKNKTIRMRDVTFALHSDNRDLLYNLVDEQSGMRIDWLNAKRYGLAYWLEGIKLQEVIETIARNEFLKFQDENNGKKDPSVCSIFYLALKKKQVLLGLWKTSIGHPEKTKMVKFLSNDFNEQRWRSAALKNAYVLLGKHRYLDAASFFLLANSVKDAVGVIMKQLDDVALAIAIARCYEGRCDGESMKYILERQILPNAIQLNDRWKLSWCFWILGDKPHAAQSLIKPLHRIAEDLKQAVPGFAWPETDSIRTENTEDPVLLVMYDNLRDRKVDYYKGSITVKPEYEFNFVIRSAVMYEKMGCDWLALDLVERWKFSDFNFKDKENVDSFQIPKAPGDLIDDYSSTKLNRPGDILARFGSGKNCLTSENGNSKSVNLLDIYSIPKSASSLIQKNSKPVDLLNKISSNSMVEKKDTTVKTPPSAAFVEPDMSAFDFGF